MKRLNRKLRMGMVGGGPGAFIGNVHHKAAILDGQVELVAGAFSSDPRKSKAKGRELRLDPARAYASYGEMLEREMNLPEGKRIDFVSIVTPNHLHFSVAKAFLEAGVPVVCDKPMTFNVAEARKLQKIARKQNRFFALTHNYTGYPMVKLARDLLSRGELGVVRKIVVQYPQGWLTTARGKSRKRLSSWRMDPQRCGAAGALGDIGTHAENLAEYLTGLRIRALCADLSTFTPRQRVDDDDCILLRFENGASGILQASRVAAGERNALAIWVYGENGGLEWHQQAPNELRVTKSGGREHIWRRGNPAIDAISPTAARATRIPAGHPEGFLQAFANVYRNATDSIRARILGEKPDPLALDFPNVDDGLRGMLFVNAALKSAQSKQKWTAMPLR